MNSMAVTVTAGFSFRFAGLFSQSYSSR